jgi:hypothetical protein
MRRQTGFLTRVLRPIGRWYICDMVNGFQFAGAVQRTPAGFFYAGGRRVKGNTVNHE